MNAQKDGFSHIVVPMLIIVLVVVGLASIRVLDNGKENRTSTQQKTDQAGSSGSNETVGSTPGSCSDKLVIDLPVPIETIESILYPGQVRGGNFKPHGGFRMKTSQNDAVSVRMPMDAKLVAGARYIEQGEVQYLFEFSNECRMRMRFDHLATLSSELQTVADTLPPAQPDDSRTTNIDGPELKKGTVVATSVGFVKNNNVSFDFGLYDDTKKNNASSNSEWAAKHQFPNDQHGVCWFDYLNQSDREAVLALPAGDMNSGNSSDYCQ